MKSSYERANELQRQKVNGEIAVKRLCAEFSESFFMLENRLIEEYKNRNGVLCHRCISIF